VEERRVEIRNKRRCIGKKIAEEDESFTSLLRSKSEEWIGDTRSKAIIIGACN
jgi:hypothetical protein